ncbi:GH92 family glycosyl hydrolase [Lentzea albidocapillata]|uniref:Alpha-1,2-mannosidase, putative n=1 Tax=Lentzea albidocapillata TaxID=40571 RepID=A0A1W2BVG1_9PSEU|nr:GH92 family glycosyl hydrolase [Lentzea albidocapillata]SMC76889.1 alpha-1,2-mannosidase, putative [Lentzea albidocapillata]
MRALPVFLVTVLTAALATPASAAVRDDTRYVDPLIGSAGGGNTYPGAVRPFGMISWSPTSTRGDQTNTGAANGYAYDATRVRGFSLTHVNGAGCHPGAAGDIPIMPHVGDITSSPTADTKDQIFASDFSHADEKAEAGRYRVGLKSGATADLSVTTRAGIGEFTFPINGSLLFRTSNSLNGSEDADITIDPATSSVSGSVLTGAFCGRRANGGTNNQKTYYRLHFTASFDRPISAHGTWVNSELRPGSTTASGGEGYLTGSARAGKGSGGYVSFADKQVRMRVGISYTSLDAAKRNLATEIPKRASVADVAKEAKKAWAKQLRAVEIDGGTADERTIFYTALYHTFLQPNVISDVGREVRYGNFSGWDQYRAHTQLLALLAPDVASGYAQSLLQTSRENGGVWDRWVHITGPTHVMTGDPSAPAIAGMYAMGAKNFDVRAAYDSLLRQATVPHPDGLSDKGCPGQCEGQRPNLAEYMRLGYAPHDTCHCWGGAAETLEDSVADQALADLGRRLGRPSEAMEERAGWWRNTFNPATGYQQARNADGTWVMPFNPASDRGFAQGSSATYTWMVPHDVQGLAEAMGGKEVAASRLDGFFKRADGSWATGGDALRYDPTNEPGIHTPWIYNELGQPRKTQETVRAMARLVYRTGPSGLPGNDDLGTMSAWYVFAALGLYPRTPSSAELHVSSPMFPKARITKKNITILATGTPGVYVQETRWNGRRIDQPWLPEAFVKHGGVLVSRLEG